MGAVPSGSAWSADRRTVLVTSLQRPAASGTGAEGMTSERRHAVSGWRQRRRIICRDYVKGEPPAASPAA